MTTDRWTLMLATVVLAALPFAAMAQPKDKAATVEGTWNMTLMSHQMALELKQDGTKVTGTFIIMATDVPVEGEFADRRLTLTGVGAKMADHNGGQPMEIKLTAKLLDDGTLEGEAVTPRGPAKWTAERLGQ